MRVSSDTAVLDVRPGDSADIGVDVVNTGAVIDGVTARVVGLPDRHVTSRPAVLPLFPDSAGRLTLTLDLPTGFPAGRHPVTVEVRSRQAETTPGYLDLDLMVPSIAGLAISSRPQVVRAHRTARFVVSVVNRGNTALDVALGAVDPERLVVAQLEPPNLVLPPATAADVLMTLKGPRMFVGTELDRPITVEATAVIVPPATTPTAPAPALPGHGTPTPPTSPPVSAPATADEPAPEPLIAICPVTLKQRPWLTRGLLTALILLSIIALWAAVFLFGLGQVFAGDPQTKSAQASAASFFVVPKPNAVVSTAAPGVPPDAKGGAGTPKVQAEAVAQAETATPEGQPVQVPGLPTAPTDAMPKDGTLPSGLAAAISGTVVAKSSGQPVGRITVEAVRRTSTGALETVSSAATQADGTYQVSGLFPGDYLLKFSATGYVDAWSPNAKSAAAARPITVASGVVTSGVDVTITGKPATITGTVDKGDTTTKVIADVTARLITGPDPAKPVGKTSTDAKGKYTLKNLPAPGTYQLSFADRKNHYQVTTVRVVVGGGAQRIQPTVPLSAGNASISGMVTDAAGKPLGQISVATTVKGTARTIATPTTGNVGAFHLDDLPTPATYVLTFSGTGYATHAESIDLQPGTSVANVNVQLASGSGTITGLLTDGTGAGLGGATVTVGGGANPVTTTTLTQGTVGQYTLTGLPDPGTYTVTFTLAGHADQTVPLTLPSTSTTLPTVTMQKSGGSISGVVRDAAGPAAGVAVVATDGLKTWPVTSTNASGGFAAGSYVIAGLPPGAYTVTATTEAGASTTALVEVTAGGSMTQNLTVAGDG